MIHRNITAKLLEALADSPVVLLTGARQTGKSTLVQALAQKEFPARYLTLDDATVLAAAREDPTSFIANLEKPVILDEIQRAPELFLALKAHVDRQRRPGQFLLTGSADPFLLPRLSESLVGRIEILTLWPFSQGELQGVQEGFIDALFASQPSLMPGEHTDRADLFSRLQTGGYPEAVARSSPDRRNAWFRAYVTTITQRDVRDMANIEHLSVLPRLLSLLAARATALLNYTELARSLALPQSTLKRYMSLLEATFLYQPLLAWSANLGKRLVKAPKILLDDTGLLAHLIGLADDRLEFDPTLFGSLLENFVAMELRKQIGWSKSMVQLYYLRTQTGHEVDLLLEDAAGRVVGIEVKAAATLGARDFRGLQLLRESLGTRFLRGVVLYTGRESVPFGPNIQALPVSALWRRER